MTDDQPNEPAKPASVPGPAAAGSGAEPPGEASPLTAEEQMARFEKELKENDWGHQPC